MIVGAVAASQSVAAAAKSGSNGGGGQYGFLIIVALLGVALYFFMLRPQRARVRRAQEQQRELHIGAKVMTASGMYATVAAIEDDAVLLEVAPGVTTRWTRAAIGRIVETEEALGLQGGPDTTPPPDGDEPDH
ncbi:MAG: preprotein translocase subunit YajC [Actinomycetes bacterium]